MTDYASSIDAITDAGLFYVGSSDTYHLVSDKSRADNPTNGPRTLRVTATCGAWADALDGATDRKAYWASGYDGEPCRTCRANG